MESKGIEQIEQINFTKIDIPNTLWTFQVYTSDTPSSPENNHQHNTDLQQDPPSVVVPLIQIETTQQEDRTESLSQVSKQNLLYVNVPTFNPERASSDRQISQTKNESTKLSFRLSSSNVSFDNTMPAIVPPDIHYAGSSVGVLNTEKPSYSEFEKSNLSGKIVSVIQ